MSRRTKKNKKRPLAIQPAKRNPRVVWGIVSVSAVLVILAVVSVIDPARNPSGRDTPTASPNEGNLAATDDHPDGHRIEAPRPSQPGPTRVAATLPVSLGRSSSEMDNPSKDGWDTELFHQKAKKQLKKLGALIADRTLIDARAHSATLATLDFSCGPLQPVKLRTVFRDQALQVERAEIDAESIKRQLPGRYHGAQGLAAAAAALSAPFRGASDVRFEFKLFRINQSAESVTTRQYFTLCGRTSTGFVEQNGTWLIRWLTSDKDAPPKLQWIGVEDFEQVTTSQQGGPLFADCTESVLGHNVAYRHQLLHGFHHWLERIQDTKQDSIWCPHGLAVGDVNGDGLDDLYVCQEAGLPNRLFIQNPDGTADDVSESSGVDWLESTRGALLVDLDNDSDQDLAITIYGSLVLAANDGQGRFEIRAVLATSDDAMSLSAVDYDNDGDLDLYVGVYDPNSFSEESVDDSNVVPLGEFVYHDANTGGRNSLFRNDISEDDNWRFSDVTQEIGLDVNNTRYTLAAAWEDFDNDGDQDLYVANDFGRNNLYRNNGSNSEGTRFVDIAATSNVEDSASGMSVTWGDFDRDGWMDLYVSNMFSSAGNRISYQRRFQSGASGQTLSLLRRHARGNSLFKNLADGTFRDVSVKSAVTMGRWAWGSKFADLNNDGLQDLIVTNGFITQDDPGDL